MQKRNCITALICAAIFAFFLIQSQMLSDTAAYWPTIICSVGLALSCLEILLEGIKWRRTADHQEKFFPLTWVQTKRGLVALGILILWVVGLNTIGFLVTSLAALCVITVWFDPQKTEKEYHSRCSFLCGHWDYCLCHVWVFGRKLPQGPVNLRGEKHL